jgi:hypothetical protein
MNNQPTSETEQVKLNIQNIRDEIGHLLLHKEVLLRLIRECKANFESKIVTTATTKSISEITKDDLAIDLVPINIATKEQIKARYEWFHYSNEFADIMVAIEAKKELLKGYQEHLAQYFNKQAQKITDDMIYEKLQKALDLKKNMSAEELKTLDGIQDEFTKRINGTKEIRIELYESLQNLILQNG